VGLGRHLLARRLACAPVPHAAAEFDSPDAKLPAVLLLGAPTEQRSRVRNRLFPFGQMPCAPTQQCSCLAALESFLEDSGVGSAGCTVGFGSVSLYLYYVPLLWLPWLSARCAPTACVIRRFGWMRFSKLNSRVRSSSGGVMRDSRLVASPGDRS
jgi:hypothetical protein